MYHSNFGLNFHFVIKKTLANTPHTHDTSQRSHPPAPPILNEISQLTAGQ